MATEEHKQLASVVKNTHALLREEYQIYGAEISWQRHIARNDVLQKYSVSMQKLATTHWKDNNANSTTGTYCRMEWIKSQCKEYFTNGGKEKYNDREVNIKLKMNIDELRIWKRTNCTCTNDKLKSNRDFIVNAISYDKKIPLLDVGSCYNPLGIEDMFEVTAIDLIAIPDTVLQCDFLNVDVGTKRILSEDTKQIVQLPENSFEVIVFSLLLEYLPCPRQRYLCCKKAYDLLKSGGILFIISPDSKHIGANAKLIKSWRYVLSKLGFMRIKYEKLRHLHCLIFRKCIFSEVASRWAHLQTFPESDPLYRYEDKIFIPQDFKGSVCGNKEEEDRYSSINSLISFNELPFANL